MNGYIKKDSSVLHIDIKEGKVWIQHNMTDQRVAEELVALGIPQENIVLGFHPPYMRKQMSEHANTPALNTRADKETFCSFDRDDDRYFLHTIGWDGTKRIWNTTVYVHIRNGKFWIEIDWTEAGIATELLAVGVPNDDIILAFHHPSVRPHTEFAVA